MAHDIFKLGAKITLLPVIYGSGDFAVEVRRLMLAERFDCLATPLPASFQAGVEQAVQQLPMPSVVTQDEQPRFNTSDWQPDSDLDDDDDDFDDDDFPEQPTLSYVPIDPCQAVIAAIRTAMGEHIPRAFIDLETSTFRPYSAALPDPYALKKVSLERFAAALLPTIERVPNGQPLHRVVHMANRLRELEEHYDAILMPCSALDWPWIREAYNHRTPDIAEHDDVEETVSYQLDPKTLIFMLGELPFITGLYERARAQLEDDENLSIDGVKELLIAARKAYQADLGQRARKITPHLLSQCLKYVRNLTLIERRMSPDLYTLVTAAKQVAGDQYALRLAETARLYPYTERDVYSRIAMGIDKARLPDGEVVSMVSRLPGPPLAWRSCDLQRRTEKSENREWGQRWNPFRQCSWPPEDEKIENFRAHVFDRAKTIMSMDLARTEKFTTSVMDGIDIRETLRHWYDGEIHVKVLPPARGNLDAVVMLFDSPADPREYPWRTTWFAEHENESTLAFYATSFMEEMVGPGIGVATYGGGLFLFPPISIPDIWMDPELDFTETMEERVLAAACLHSRSSTIALLSPLPPGAGWRRLAKRYGKSIVHVPLGQFGASTIQQLRMVHVLNGKHVRSYASEFIRKA